MKKRCIVYWLFDDTCRRITRDGYVGITTGTIKRRVWRHRLENKRLPKDFKYRVIFEGTIAQCIRRENKLRPDKMIGWNVATGGRPLGIAMAGVPKPRTQRALMRAAAIRRYTDPSELIRLSAAVIVGMKAAGHDNVGPNNGRFGKPMSKSGIRKMRATIAKNGGRSGANNPMFGRRRSETERRKISEGVKAAGPRTPAQNRRQRRNTPRGERHPRFGRHWSAEVRLKNSRSQLARLARGEPNGFAGKKHSEKTRRLLSRLARARNRSRSNA